MDTRSEGSDDERKEEIINIAVEAEVPIVTVKRKRADNAGNKRRLKRLMAVGDMLKQVSSKLVTEDNEYDVDEDEYGNISIGGTELSFENWALLNRISEPDIVCSSIVVADQLKGPLVEQLDSCSLGATVEIRESVGTAEVILETPKPEKEEGEISDSDSGVSDGDLDSGENKGRLSATMCQVISSSSRDIYERRFGIAQSLSLAQKLMLLKLIEKSQEINLPSNTATSASDVQKVFQEIYAYRFQVIQALSVQQKSSLLEVIRSPQEKIVS